MTDRPQSPYEPLVKWVLASRDDRARAPELQKISRAVTPALAVQALQDAAVRARVDTVPSDRRQLALQALSLLARSRLLRHSPRVPLGVAFTRLQSPTVATRLALIPGSSYTVAHRLLGNTALRAGAVTPMDLVELFTLLTDWEHLDIEAKMAFLVTFHARTRA